MTFRVVWPKPVQLVVLLAVTVGLGLRLAAARGGLWLDEAWSAVYAAEARTPLGVFISINHDNNHHLNSLWLQAVGLNAPPLLARALSIMTGTLCIPVAAAIGARRSPSAGMIAAILFAVSPIMVNYGAEARGYASMVLALLAAIWVTDRWLDDPDATPPPRLALGLLAALGLLSQLTMVFGLVAIGGWAWIRLLKDKSWRAALDTAFSLMSLAIAATLLIFALVFGAASITGLRVGSYESFELPGFLEALHYLVRNTTGIALPFVWLTILVVLLLILSALYVPVLRPRLALYLLMIVGLPAMIALLQAPNSHYARYFLVSGVGMLLLAADWLGSIIGRPGAPRAAAFGIGALLVAASLILDVRMIGNDRGDPSAPVRMMRGEAPGGTSILLDNIRSTAVLQVAAASAHYPLVIRQRCPAEPYLLLDGVHGRAFPDLVHRCGAAYRPALTHYTRTLGGIDWRLYRRTDGD